jgi:hypothetical protein
MKEGLFPIVALDGIIISYSIKRGRNFGIINVFNFIWDYCTCVVVSRVF